MNILLAILILIAVLLGVAHLRTRQMAAQAEAMVPRTGNLQPVAGGTIHYLDLGPREAQVLVLIHGLGGQLQHFTYAMADLLSDDFRLIVVDRPGAGYSDRDSSALAAFSEQARMIGELLDILKVDNPVLVGHSLGGAISLAMALDRPDKTRALALLAPATQEQSNSPDVFKGLEIRSGWLRVLLGQTIAVPIARASADKMLTAVFAPEAVVPDFMTRAAGALGLRPRGFVSTSEDLVAFETSMPPQVARYGGALNIPGGILFGAGDAVLSPELHGKSMQAHGLSYEELGGRGHMLPMTAPQECVDFVRRIAARG
jgi:pimeloyl-ACP methyl ester carboxylesterase